MTTARRKLLSSLARLLVAGLFIFLAVRGVTLRDQVTLRTGDDPDLDRGGPVFRLLATTPDSVTVRLPDGGTRVVPRERVAIDAAGDELIVRGLLHALRTTDLRILGLALLLFTPVPFIQSWRLQVMLGTQDIRLALWQCIKLSFAGNFLNFVFMVGSTAGDVYKAYCVTLHTPHRTEAVTTILLDRIVGLAGLLIVTGGMIWLGGGDPRMMQLGRAVLGVLVLLGVGAALLSTSWFTRWVPAERLARLPGWAQFRRVYATAERLVRFRRRVVLVVGMTVLLQFVCLGSGVLCALALGMDFSGTKVWDYFACIGAGFVVAAVPIAPQGLGTMELAYKAFFLNTHGTLSQLLCLAFWVRMVLLTWSLPGALVALLGAHRPSEVGRLPTAASESA